MEGLPVWKPYSNADTIWALPMGKGGLNACPDGLGKLSSEMKCPREPVWVRGGGCKSYLGNAQIVPAWLWLGLPFTPPPPLCLTLGGSWPLPGFAVLGHFYPKWFAVLGHFWVQGGGWQKLFGQYPNSAHVILTTPLSCTPCEIVSSTTYNFVDQDCLNIPIIHSFTCYMCQWQFICLT